MTLVGQHDWKTLSVTGQAAPSRMAQSLSFLHLKAALFRAAHQSAYGHTTQLPPASHGVLQGWHSEGNQVEWTFGHFPSEKRSAYMQSTNTRFTCHGHSPRRHSSPPTILVSTYGLLLLVPLPGRGVGLSVVVAMSSSKCVPFVGRTSWSLVTLLLLSVGKISDLFFLVTKTLPQGYLTVKTRVLKSETPAQEEIPWQPHLTVNQFMQLSWSQNTSKTTGLVQLDSVFKIFKI